MCILDKIKQHPVGSKNGISRRVLVIRGRETSAFEEAIFILRAENGISDEEFMEEAKKLADEYSLSADPPPALGLPFVIVSLIAFLSLAAWAVFFFV